MLSRAATWLGRANTACRFSESSPGIYLMSNNNLDLYFVRTFAIERSREQTAAPNPQQPVVEEDFQGTKQNLKAVYESMVAEVSGVAEDVRLKDQESTSLGKMAVDPRGPENGRVKAARSKADSSTRELYDEKLADAVFDDTKSTADAMEETTYAEDLVKGPGTASKPTGGVHP